MIYWDQYARRPGFVRWATRGRLFRYCVIRSGDVYLWQRVELGRGVIMHSGDAYPSTLTCLLAIRKWGSTVRAWIREMEIAV